VGGGAGDAGARPIVGPGRVGGVGDVRIDAAEARPADVGGTTTGADSRATLDGSSRSTTSSGVSVPSPGAARTNPPSPTPARVPTAAAIFQSNRFGPFVMMTPPGRGC
jgi:hypothetical protein